MEKIGEIEIILGPMFSGKTKELLRRAEIYHSIGMKVLIINSELDSRSDGKISSHSSFINITNSNIDIIKIKNLTNIGGFIESYDVICIDEGNFFLDLVDFVIYLFEKNKKVIISSLDGNFERKKFGKVLDLIPLSSSVVKLCAKCKMCYSEFGIIRDAPYSKRISESLSEIDVGGKDKYIAVCQYHYVK